MTPAYRLHDVDEVDVTRGPYRWFLTLWPLAVVFHLAGNDFNLINFTSVGVAQLFFLAAAVLMLVRPSVGAAAALAASHLLVVYVKFPLVGNHEILLLLTNLAILLAIALKQRQWLPTVVPALRWTILIAYSAIAFSKLNEGFIDRAVSCAVVFGDEFGEWVGVSVSRSAGLSNAVIAGTIVFEVAIPVLLMTRRWRRLGVVVGVIFHTVLALEPAGHVFDFTSVLFMLFLLFLSAEESERFSGAVESARSTLGTPRIVALLGVIIIGNYLANGLVVFGWAVPNWLFDYPIFLAYAAFVLRHVIPTGGPVAEPRRALDFRVAPVLGVVVALAALNAASPYLEIRTAGAFNMYSNLAVHNGDTNHLLLPRTLPLREPPPLYEAPFDPEHRSGLDFYGRDGLLIPEPNLAQWAGESRTGDAPVRLAYAEQLQPITSAEEVAAAANPADSLWERIFYLRAVDSSEPASCKRFWGPAH